MNEAFDKARNMFLGPRNLRTRTRPAKPTNAKGNRTHEPLTGGIAYERSKVCKSVQEPSRCYTLGPSGEAPTSIVAPVASAKMATEEIAEDAAVRQQLLTAAAAIAMAAYSEAPPIVRERTRQHAALINLPAIGVANNYAYATAQVNVASAKRPAKPSKNGKKAKEPSLAGDMGFYGGAHTDGKDGVGHFSHMSANSDLPDDDEVPEGQEYTPGFFFILELGVFIVLDRHASINFSGLRRHGGTPPLCSPNLFRGKPAKLYKFAYRFVVIFYPPTRMMDGTARLTLGAMPHNEAFILPPEMLHAGVTDRIEKGWPAQSHCERASFVREGVLMMCQRALVTFVVRSLLLLCYYFLLQLPSRYRIRIDPDIFIQSITMQLDGKRINTGPWEFAPGHRIPNRGPWVDGVDCPDDAMVNQDVLRSAAWARWDAWVALVATHTPSVGCRGPIVHHIPTKLAKGEVLAANVPVDGYEGADEGVPKRPTKQPRKPRKKKPMKEGHRTEDGDSETDSETGGKARQKSAARVGRARRQQQAESSAAEDSSSDEDAGTKARRLRAAARAARAEQESCEEMPDGEADETVASSSDSDSRSSSDEEAVPKPKAPSPTAGPAGPSLRRSRRNADAPLPEPSPERPSKRPRVATGTAKSSFPTDQQRVWATDSYAQVAASAVPESTPVSRGRRSSRLAAAPGPEWNHATLSGSDDEPDIGNQAALRRGALERSELGQSLTLVAVHRNMEDIRSSWNTISNSPAHSDVPQLDAAYTALLLHPSECTTARHFHAIWSGLDQLNTLHAMNSLRVRLDRECIMLTNFSAWRWLDAYCPEIIREAFKNQRRGLVAGSNWIAKLAQDVTGVLENRVEHHLFHAAEYQLTLTTNGDFVHSNKRPQMYLGDRELLDAVILLTTRIIASWLQFPVAGVSRYQAWLVYAIIRTLGRGALMLDEVWRGYTQIRKYVLGESVARKHCNERFSHLCVELASHSLADSASTESLVLAELAELIGSIRTAPPSSPPALIEMEPSPAHQVPLFDPTPASRSVLPPTSHPLHTNLPDQVRRNLTRFADFIDEAWAVTVSPHSVPNRTNWQTAMLASTDRLCPFRELAPSRVRASGPDGPFGTEAVTTSSFYSALIFRAITFNTDFFRTSQLCFRDHRDFERVMRAAEKQYSTQHGGDPLPSFFCNSHAYGPHNPGRTVELARVYGPLVVSDNIAAQLSEARKQGRTTLAFTACWKWLKGKGSDKRVRFSNLGPLGSYLLAADYTYTSPRLVDPPTFEELGQIICTMNKGAVHGLERLGLIPQRPVSTKGDALQSTPAACVEGLKIVHSMLSAHLSPEQQDQVHFDLIMIEHSLCKLSRAISLGKFSL
ncbi:hypothetical protein B0H11DRAFT_2237846 [Mycena galericulata]|nr:hypothetical protein B0H11DRAFT_2237846 [Mycena galericulata]